MDEVKTDNLNTRRQSYINHVSHIRNIPNPDQCQYLNYSHSIAWSFPKEKKCKYKIILYLY